MHAWHHKPIRRLTRVLCHPPYPRRHSPFLAVAGGKIEVASLTGVKSVQPHLTIRMTGASSTIQSVKIEIMQRIQRHFMTAGLRIDWDEPQKKGGF